MILFITTAVKTSNPTTNNLLNIRGETDISYITWEND
jgi:hypothetical protein